MDWNKEIKIPRPSFSGLKRLLNSGPQLSLKTPSIGRSSTKGPLPRRPKALSRGPQIKIPRLVTDLYADLRDRHLLPVVVVLIALIIAAPILLGNSSEKKEPAGATAAVAGAGGETSDSSFTVVPAARHLRSPQKRLGRRQALNPFRIDTEAAAEASEASETGSGGSEGSESGGEASGGESSSGGSSSSEATEGATAGGSTSTETNVTVKVSVVAYVAAIKTGYVPGELTGEREISPMTKLPSAKDPLVLFTGFSEDDKRALFLMTSKVTGYYGEVHCAVDKKACQMVELEPGHAAIFSYGLGKDEKRYKIVLQKIEPVTSTAESANAKTVEKTEHERPAERDSAIAQARSFSK
ncbi:MAG: hypothetical protein QM729_04635 [Solirubrobacterales bacterium]